MNESEPPGREPADDTLAAAIEEASRSLGVPYREPGEPETREGPTTGLGRGIGIAMGVLLVGLLAALALRGAGSSTQPAHLVEADLRWAVARVVEQVEEERLLRGRIPEEPRIRLLLGEALSYSMEEGGYRIVGRRDGVEVEYDGSLPLEEWRALVLYPEVSGTR